MSDNKQIIQVTNVINNVNNVNNQCVNPACSNCTLLSNQTTQLVQTIKNTIGDGELNSSNLCTVCIQTMQVVETFPNVKGQEKKSLVMQALEAFIKENELDPHLLDIIPSFIDSAMDIVNGKVSIGTVQEIGTACCLGLCTVLNSGKSKKVKK